MRRVILLADDSPAIRKVVELTFDQAEIRVESSGSAAWRSVRDSPPDIVLADSRLEEPDGYELCRRIKASSHPVPVLLLSGRFDAFDAGRARECGADGHLRKPFEPAALRRSVERLLRDSTTLDPRGWSPEALDALSRAVALRLAERAVRDAVAELLPEIAERVVRERIRQLEQMNDFEDDGSDGSEDPAARGA